MSDKPKPAPLADGRVPQVLPGQVCVEEALERETPSPPRATAQPCNPPALAAAPDLLERLRADLRRMGLVGEEEAAQVLYLAIVSRLLEQPVSVAVKGPSSAGKSFLVDTVLAFFPPAAFYAMSAMSERALAYSQEPLEHRMLVLFEAAGMSVEGIAPYLLRSLLSEGCVRYETVESTGCGLRPKLIERRGPTGLIVTTTEHQLHPENETRLLSLGVTDTPEQTKRVMLSLAADGDRPAPDLAPWLELQDWLAEGERQVTIPYARRLAELVPPAAVRLRRDFAAVLGLVRAHALLHRATRGQDEQGRIVAALADYVAVRELVRPIIEEGVGATVRPETRETVQAVAELEALGEGGVPQARLARRLELDKGAVSRRVRVALEGGYLRNLEERRGRPHRLVVGDPLPEELVLLPEPEALRGCTVARRADTSACADDDAGLAAFMDRLAAARRGEPA
jgi:hypothetical protein